jgi:ParB-like chromosome segregation protein Spo0J
MIQNIPIEDVRLGPQYHPTRLWTDPKAIKWVEHYRAQIRAGVVLAPIKLDPRFFIVDGHHRWYACKLEKCSTIRAIIKSASELTI